MRLRLLTALLVALLAPAWPRASGAQELNCSVSVNYSNLEGAEFSFLDELEGEIEDYFNEENWTDDRFQETERISCNVELFFQEATSLTEFRAQLVVATRRPIYGTSQQTLVTRLRDENLEFSYTKGQPLTHNLEQYGDLTTVLDFYAYLMLGYDYDTFSELGGTPHFEQVRNLAELAQANGASGWTPVGGQGRVALITQLLDSRYQPFRRALFRYHLRSLDRFVGETEAARQSALEALQAIQAVDEKVSRRYVLDLFFAVKSEELAALFEESPLQSEGYALLSQLDAAHLSTYESLQ
jgi:hypothetical protein